ncbi:unnamed protein product [Amoebophrya sp. A120]|nr:unnamed protein product [Amoebophrya sp. A120]|eukprot:GSA120T00016118001.1
MLVIQINAASSCYAEKNQFSPEQVHGEPPIGPWATTFFYRKRRRSGFLYLVHYQINRGKPYAEQ